MYTGPLRTSEVVFSVPGRSSPRWNYKSVSLTGTTSIESSIAEIDGDDLVSFGITIINDDPSNPVFYVHVRDQLFPSLGIPSSVAGKTFSFSFVLCL